MNSSRRWLRRRDLWHFEFLFPKISFFDLDSPFRDRSSSRISSSANVRPHYFVRAILRLAYIRLAFLRVDKYSSRIYSSVHLFVCADVRLANIRPRHFVVHAFLRFSFVRLYIYSSAQMFARDEHLQDEETRRRRNADEYLRDEEMRANICPDTAHAPIYKEQLISDSAISDDS